MLCCATTCCLDSLNGLVAEDQILKGVIPLWCSWPSQHQWVDLSTRSCPLLGLGRLLANHRRQLSRFSFLIIGGSNDRGAGRGTLVLARNDRPAAPWITQLLGEPASARPVCMVVRVGLYVAGVVRERGTAYTNEPARRRAEIVCCAAGCRQVSSTDVRPPIFSRLIWRRAPAAPYRNEVVTPALLPHRCAGE